MPRIPAAEQQQVAITQPSYPVVALPQAQVIVAPQIEPVSIPFDGPISFIFIVIPAAFALAFIAFANNIRSKNTKPASILQSASEDLPPLSFPLNYGNPVNLVDYLEREDLPVQIVFPKKQPIPEHEYR